MAGHAETVVEQFTEQAAGFSAAAPIRDPALLELIVEASAVASTDRVLDVACGPGIVTCAFAACAAEAVGVDLTPAMLDRARALAAERGLANLEWITADVLALPFADGAFDVVVSRFALHHLEDPAAALAEMARVCAAGGVVVVCDLAPAPACAGAFNAIERVRDPSHVRALTEDAMLELFGGVAGLGEVEVTRTALGLELEAHLERSFPAPPDGRQRVRDLFTASLEDDRLGIGVRQVGASIEYAYPVAVYASRRVPASGR